MLSYTIRPILLVLLLLGGHACTPTATVPQEPTSTPLMHATPTLPRLPGAHRTIPRPQGTVTVVDGWYIPEPPPYPGATRIDRELSRYNARRTTTFKTTDSAEAVQHFYHDVMLQQGWQQSPNQSSDMFFHIAPYLEEDGPVFTFYLTLSSENEQTIIMVDELISWPHPLAFPSPTPDDS